MLIEVFLAETSYLIPALRSNYENTRGLIADCMSILRDNDFFEEYYKLQGYNLINLALIENFEKIRSKYYKLVEEHYLNLRQT